MPLSYDYIEKPEQVQFIDKLFTGNAKQLKRAYAMARELLTDATTLDETTRKIAGGEKSGLPEGLTPDDVDHFRNHWLSQGSEPSHPWAGRHVEKTMRDAYLHAVNVADTKPRRPIETFWVFSNIERFEMRVSESDDRVTVFALIPKTPEIELGGAPPANHRIRSFRSDPSLA